MKRISRINTNFADYIPKGKLDKNHRQLDLVVDSCYRERPFADENERLEWLLKLYEKMTAKK